MSSNTPNDLFFQPDIYESQFAYASQFPDIPFWIELAKEFGPKVLELACGNGRVTIPVFQSGVDIDGLDFSESLLNAARSRACANSLPVKFFHGDIRSLSLRDKYNFMFLPTGTISHLIQRSEVESFLAGVHQALHTTGVLALDFHNPSKTFLSQLPLDPNPRLSSFELQTTKEAVQLTTTQRYETDTQIYSMTYVYAFANGSTQRSTLNLRLYFPIEAEALLNGNGFEVVNTYGDYSRSHLTSEHSKYVIVARKRL